MRRIRTAIAGFCLTLFGLSSAPAFANYIYSYVPTPFDVFQATLVVNNISLPWVRPNLRPANLTAG